MRSPAAGGGLRDLARDALERRHVRTEAARAAPERLEHDRGRTADLLRQRVEQVLHLDGAGARLLLGAREELQHRVREVGQAPGRLVDAREACFHLDGDVGRVGAGALEDLLDAAVALDGARQQVNGLDLGVIALVG